MKDKKFNVQLGIGAPSIFMIFVIMVMCTIAILAYMDSASYYDSSLQQINSVKEYYNAQSEGLEAYHYIKKEYNGNNLNLLLKKRNLKYQLKNDVLIYQYDMNDKQCVIFNVNMKDFTYSYKQIAKED